MSASHPPAPSANTADPLLVALAARIGMEMPAACEDGVRESLAVLDQHWGKLRRALDDGFAE